jgi:transposase-like protein
MDLILVPKPSHLRSIKSNPAPAAQGAGARGSGRSVEAVPKSGKRRTFSAAEKLRIVTEADACLTTGKRGDLEALLRREGIYSSLLSAWRLQLGAFGAGGLAAKKPGRKPKLTEAERRNVELTKLNAELERKLRIANALIALQKKAHEVLGLALPESDGES